MEKRAGLPTTPPFSPGPEAFTCRGAGQWLGLEGEGAPRDRVSVVGHLQGVGPLLPGGVAHHATTSKVKASGPGLKGGVVGSPALFSIDTKGAGTGGLGLTVEGPTEAKIECSDNGDGTCSVSYLPTEPGDYLVNILFEEVHVPGSPFRADVLMPFDPSQVVVSGSGLQRAKVGEVSEFNVDCSRAGPGQLTLEAGPESPGSGKNTGHFLSTYDTL
ncbi:hypothetical protein CRUP_013947 [Coryphaenoides rupestris]|nr:hypothetical protein CRUP_013947 [Coryphaenoides rupestris]